MNGIEQTLIGGVDAGAALLFPALGELVGERAGVVNLGIEGCMLAAALTSYAVGVTSGSIWLGIVAGIAAGAAVGGIHAWLTIIRGADQLASGLAVWFFALGLTSVFGTSYINQTITPLAPVTVPVLGHIPWVGPILFKHDLLVYVGYVLVGVVSFVLFRTRLGLLVRASGERPEVVAAAGGSPRMIRVAAVVVGGGLAALGGAQLSVSYVGNWFSNMTSGYGFVAVAVVLFAAWRPVRVAAGALLFGVALASASVLQAHGVAVNQYLLDALPYLITLLALVVFSRGGSSKAPESLRRALTNTG